MDTVILVIALLIVLLVLVARLTRWGAHEAGTT